MMYFVFLFFCFLMMSDEMVIKILYKSNNLKVVYFNRSVVSDRQKDVKTIVQE